MERAERLGGLLPLALGVTVILAAGVYLASCSSGSSEPVTAPETTTTAVPSTTTTQAAPGTTAAPDEDGTEPATTAADLVALGQSLAARNGCAVCHISTGAPTVGPEWVGLYGTTETLDDGSTVEVDDAYLRESIIDPNAKITAGYSAGIMPPTFADTLSEEEIDAIIAYIQSLG